MVKDFCELYNIPFEFLILKKDDYSEGNFQSWVREKRYSFFTKVYKKYNCEKLLINFTIWMIF
ncbi:ATP-binding protein [Mycoplasmopsis cynos]|uniref:ATP-binding protein n=1 Tax=Mycoplasmopsis cynos TaxID=171284 RepID=UPI0021FBEC05|nr:ATP-binding protein [Mycoplasmopsis cynos]UWV93061.1 hypothetical protein NWE57_01170 [Mycoplasmopsis cynos]